MTDRHTYTLMGNVDREETRLDFDREVPLYLVLQIENELIWHYPQDVFSRAIGGVGRDRHFAGTPAVVVGISQPELIDDDES